MVRALTGPVHGNRQVAQSLLALPARRRGNALTTHPVNGRTGLVARYHHQVAAVISLDIADHHVTQVWVILNPDKLRAWNQSPPPNPTLLRRVSAELPSPSPLETASCTVPCWHPTAGPGSRVGPDDATSHLLTAQSSSPLCESKVLQCTSASREGGCHF